MTGINLIFTLLLSYPWPMRPFYQAHSVSATLGDGRGSVAEPRFHWGIDIPAGLGTDVFSITSGTAVSIPSENLQIEGTVRVSNYWYIHLTYRIRDGMEITGILENPINPDRIGDVAVNHLHFQIGPSGGPFVNPLSYDGGPVNYTDNGMPIVWGSTTAQWFWRSGSEGQTAQQVQSPIWAKIDLRAYCQDRQTSGGANITSGIYRLEWLLRDRDLGTSFGPYQTTIFPQVQPPNNGASVLLVYDRHAYRAESPFHYWATNPIINNQVEDRYWNTKLRQGQEWNGLDARINTEAEFPDGNYRVWVMAYDIRNNGGDTLNRHGAEDEDVALDNFVPFVEQLTIYQEEKDVKYDAHWELADNALRLVKDVDSYARVGKPLEFYLFFDQRMNTNVHPEIIVAFITENIK